MTTGEDMVKSQRVIGQKLRPTGEKITKRENKGEGRAYTAFVFRVLQDLKYVRKVAGFLIISLKIFNFDV